MGHRTCLPDGGGVSILLPTEDGLVPGAKQMADFLSVSIVHVSVNFVLLGAPVASLSGEGHRISNLNKSRIANTGPQ